MPHNQIGNTRLACIIFYLFIYYLLFLLLLLLSFVIIIVFYFWAVLIFVLFQSLSVTLLIILMLWLGIKQTVMTCTNRVALWDLGYIHFFMSQSLRNISSLTQHVVVLFRFFSFWFDTKWESITTYNSGSCC